MIYLTTPAAGVTDSAAVVQHTSSSLSITAAGVRHQAAAGGSIRREGVEAGHSVAGVRQEARCSTGGVDAGIDDEDEARRALL